MWKKRGAGCVSRRAGAPLSLPPYSSRAVAGGVASSGELVGRRRCAQGWRSSATVDERRRCRHPARAWRRADGIILRRGCGVAPAASFSGEGGEVVGRRWGAIASWTGNDEAEWVASRVQGKGRSEPAREKCSDPAFPLAWLGGLFLHRPG